MRNPLPRNIVLWLIMGGIFGVSFAVSAAQATLHKETAPMNVVAQRDFGSWKYSAAKEDGVIMIAVELTQKDQKGLRAYMQANTELAATLFQTRSSLEGRIIFKRPVREQELPEAVLAERSQVKGYELRVKGDKNEKFTIFGIPSTDEFLPQNMLTHMVADIKAKSGRADLKGLTTITMSMTAAQYQELANSPNVLFIDIAPEAALEDYQQSSGTSAEAERIMMSPVPAYWYYEEVVNP